jgi:hypothetical protein
LPRLRSRRYRSDHEPRGLRSPGEKALGRIVTHDGEPLATDAASDVILHLRHDNADGTMVFVDGFLQS